MDPFWSGTPDPLGTSVRPSGDPQEVIVFSRHFLAMATATDETRRRVEQDCTGLGEVWTGMASRAAQRRLMRLAARLVPIAALHHEIAAQLATYAGRLSQLQQQYDQAAHQADMLCRPDDDVWQWRAPVLAAAQEADWLQHHFSGYLEQQGAALDAAARALAEEFQVLDALGWGKRAVEGSVEGSVAPLAGRKKVVEKYQESGRHSYKRDRLKKIVTFFEEDPRGLKAIKMAEWVENGKLVKWLPVVGAAFDAAEGYSDVRNEGGGYAHAVTAGVLDAGASMAVGYVIGEAGAALGALGGGVAGGPPGALIGCVAGGVVGYGAGEFVSDRYLKPLIHGALNIADW